MIKSPFRRVNLMQAFEAMNHNKPQAEVSFLSPSFLKPEVIASFKHAYSLFIISL